MSLLEVRNLSTGYGTTRVLSDVSLSLTEGRVMAIFGRNGVGKTTLLRAILGLLPDTEGSVQLDGVEIRSMPTHQIVRRGVAYAAQEQGLFPDHTVLENLQIAMRGSRSNHLEALLDDFPRIRERGSQVAGTLSGGEQKMLLAVRTLATARRVAILDEIVEGVQPSLLAMFQQAIRHARERGLSILLVEQHLAFALPVSDDYLVISGGTVVESGRVTDQTASDIEQHLVL